MRQTIRSEQQNRILFRAIYRLLNRVNPVDFDCGLLCNKSCCIPETPTPEEEEDLGIYLYPGEELVHDQSDDWLLWKEDTAEDHDLPDSWTGTPVYFIRCRDPLQCKRELRPIQCRTFPLQPHLTEEGQLSLIFCDLDLPYVCPLIGGENELNGSFIRAVYTVWKHLIEDPRIYDFVRMDSEDREWEDAPYVTVYTR